MSALFPDSSEFDRLLAACQRGDTEAMSRLWALSYAPLRSIAGHVVGPSGEFQAMGPSALVHEGFMKILRGDSLPGIRDSQHFFALLTSCMKQVLLDYVRQKQRLKRGGAWQRVELEATLSRLQVPESRFSELLEALELLRDQHPRAASIFEAKTIIGRSTAEVAHIHEVSHSTVEADFRFAKAFLRVKLG